MDEYEAEELDQWALDIPNRFDAFQEPFYMPNSYYRACKNQ